MTPYDKTQIWTELRRLDKDKANTCPVKEMSDRINYQETIINNLRQRVQALEDLEARVEGLENDILRMQSNERI